VRLRGEPLPAPVGDVRSWWRFTIEDTGIGIEPEAAKQLFQRFVQADSSTTRNFGGSGLGLAISKHLVELMGGRIDAFSMPGTGSRFWFELPFDAAINEAEAAPSTNLRAANSQLSGLKVLVVEDNILNQMVIKALLTRLGAVVTVVDNGEIAVRQVQCERFDVALMDCMMPVMDGYEATRRIRAWEHEQAGMVALPIIALTANALASDREVCLAAGMTDYLTKPIASATLEQILMRYAPARVTA
jgi:two-component system, sensor histidine kinase